jgi:gas vesicle protein
MSERDEFGAFLIGFVIGGLTGAVVSLLIAPQSGAETRVLIKERAIELGDRVSETAQTVSKEVETRTGEYKVKAEEYASKARAGVEDLSKKGQVVMDEQNKRTSPPAPPAEKPETEPPAAG